MSYESAVVLFIVFLIPAVIFVVTRIINIRYHEQREQAELDMIFSSHKEG